MISPLIQPAAVSPASVSTNLQNAGADPCALTLSQGLSSSLSVSSLQSLLQSGLASLSGGQTGLNALNIPALSSALNSINSLVAALKTPIPMGLTISTPGNPLFQIVNSIIGSVINSVIKHIEQLAVNEAKQLATQAVQTAIASVSNLTAGNLRKDMGPVLAVLNAITGIVGKVEGEKAYVQAVLNTANTCPATAAIMAEAFFKKGAIPSAVTPAPIQANVSVSSITSTLTSAVSTTANAIAQAQQVAAAAIARS